MEKFSSRIFAVFIAAVMVVTAIPFTPVTALAAEAEEVYGYVDIDPVIYIHGDSASGDAYDYMKYGSTISDASYAGECETNVVISPAKTCVGVELVDESTDSVVSIVDGRLSGDLGSAYANTTSGTATLKFNFEDGTYELHKFAVKANPVDKHTLVAMFGYENYLGIAGSRRIVAFEVLALGSMSTPEVVGRVALLGKDKQETSVSKSDVYGNKNFAAMYEPYDATYRFSEGDYKIGYSGAVEDSDKNSGFYGGVMVKGTEAYTALTTTQNTADYYLDLSTSKNYGIEHTPGEVGAANADDYSLNLLFGNVQLYSSQKTKSNNPNPDDTFHALTTTKSNKGSTMFANSDLMPATLTTGSEEGLAYKTNVTISGDAVKGDVIEGTYKVTYADKNSHTSIASSETKIKITVSDKSLARSCYNDIVKALHFQKISSKCYTAESWSVFHDTLLATEAYLNDNTNTSDDSTAAAQLKATYNSLVVDNNAEHFFITYSPKDAATCTSNATEVSKCSMNCGAERIREIPETSLGHSMSTEVIAPTCENGGYTKHYCTREGCGYYYNDTYVSRLGHSYAYTSNSDRTHTVTCTNDASHTYNEACSFNYTVKQPPTYTANGIGEYKCTKCSYSYEVSIEKSTCSHSNTEIRNKLDPTCKTVGYSGDTYCVDCNTRLAEGVELNELGHNYNYVVNDDAVEPTCKAEGSTASKTGTCTREGCTSTTVIDGDVIPKLSHSYGVKTLKESEIAATCTSTGKTAVYSELCTECGDERITGGETVSINEAAHPVVRKQRIDTPISEATCITKGSYLSELKCLDCGAVIESRIVYTSYADHTFTNYVFDDDSVTCQSVGATETAHCDVEGCDAIDQRVIPAERLPHNVESYTSNDDATCTNDGTKTGVCTLCGESITVKDEGSKLGHDWAAATCTAPKTCNRCDAIEGTALGHDWAAATCTAPKTCNRCDAIEGTALGHDWAGATCTAPKTCNTCGVTDGAPLGHSFGTNNPTCAICGASNPNYVAPTQPTTPTQPTQPTQPTTPTQPITDTMSSTGVSISDVQRIYGVDEATAQQIIYVINQYNISPETLNITENNVTSRADDSDFKGSSFFMLRAQAKKIDKKSVKISWNSVKGADGYIVYFAKCGKANRLKKVATVSAKTKSYTFKKLKKGTYYKMFVVAYKKVGGSKVTIAGSKTIHAVTTGGKYGVAKSVKIKKIGKKKNAKSATLKLGKSTKIVASEIKKDKPIKAHRKVCFESDNPKVATVNAKGKVVAKGKGKCKIYAYAQNGVYKTVSITVK